MNLDWCFVVVVGAGVYEGRGGGLARGMRSESVGDGRGRGGHVRECWLGRQLYYWPLHDIVITNIERCKGELATLTVLMTAVPVRQEALLGCASSPRSASWRTGTDGTYDRCASSPRSHKYRQCGQFAFTKQRLPGIESGSCHIPTDNTVGDPQGRKW